MKPTEPTNDDLKITRRNQMLTRVTRELRTIIIEEGKEMLIKMKQLNDEEGIVREKVLDERR